MARIRKPPARSRKRLGTPPAVASRNLSEPETAPAKVDGRSLRATGRTHQFATRIREETYWQIKEIAARDRLKMAELIELAVEAYEKQQTSR